LYWRVCEYVRILGRGGSTMGYRQKVCRCRSARHPQGVCREGLPLPSHGTLARGAGGSLSCSAPLATSPPALLLRGSCQGALAGRMQRRRAMVCNHRRPGYSWWLGVSGEATAACANVIGCAKGFPDRCSSAGVGRSLGRMGSTVGYDCWRTGATNR